MAKQCRPGELAHERVRELLEGVGEDQHLRAAAQFVEELARSGHWLELGDDCGDVGQPQSVLVEDGEAPAHQHVVVGLVASSALQRFDAGSFGDGDPDLGDQNSLQVEGDDRLTLVGGHPRSVVSATGPWRIGQRIGPPT